MVGTEAEHSGSSRGARFVEAMATATVLKLVLTVNHASGAGYYAMAGQGFDPDFLFTLPTGRMGVMEGESAVRALFGPSSTGSKPRASRRTMISRRESTPSARTTRSSSTRVTPRPGVTWTSCSTPERLRDRLGFVLWTSLHNPGPHLGAFTLPEAGPVS